ncbi:MAG: 3-deoxy-manno-octulosonate cytidylyltransferase, partial [Gammaproteobacteria bacterium]|nr:3-deoxy-manno-octulosonate cytidylyltransferase [Gammaproteobacteria bacterium]
MTAPFHIIIPARYAATRLPGKPLLDLGGKTMIARVVDCARRSAAASVTVATDDARIVEAAAAAGARALLTAATHRSGSDRIDEAAAQLQLGADDIIVNLQGDEPRMPAALINQVAARLASDPQAEMATATAPLDDAAQLADPAVVKVVTCARGYALYFSRAAIPWGGD